MRFRSRPVYIEAVQVRAVQVAAWPERPAWLTAALARGSDDERGTGLTEAAGSGLWLSTRSYTVQVRPGEWLVYREDGSLGHLHDQAFTANYEAVE